jgi:hypothetical protein
VRFICARGTDYEGIGKLGAGKGFLFKDLTRFEGFGKVGLRVVGRILGFACARGEVAPELCCTYSVGYGQVISEGAISNTPIHYCFIKLF